jgi:hypothetical protein
MTAQNGSPEVVHFGQKILLKSPFSMLFHLILILDRVFAISGKEFFEILSHMTSI